MITLERMIPTRKPEEDEVKYNERSQSTGTVNNIFDVYPWLQSFLGAYCSGGSGSYQVRVMRG